MGIFKMPAQKKKSAIPHGKIPIKKVRTSKSQSRNWWVGVIAQMNQKKLCKKGIKIKATKSKLKVTKPKNKISKQKASKTKSLKKKKANDNRKKVQAQPKAWKIGKHNR